LPKPFGWEGDLRKNVFAFLKSFVLKGSLTVMEKPMILAPWQEFNMIVACR